MLEVTLIIAAGIISSVRNLGELGFPLWLNILGGFLILGSSIFHIVTERVHKQSHDAHEDINKIVDTGIYGVIRHPLYLSLIIRNLGFALAFGTIIPFILFGLSMVHWILSIEQEEKTLINLLPDYQNYRQKVRWKLVPGIY